MLTEVTTPWKNDLQTKATKQERFSLCCLGRNITFIQMGFHTDGHKIIRSRYGEIVQFQLSRVSFLSIPFKKQQDLLHRECLCIRFFLHPFFQPWKPWNLCGEGEAWLSKAPAECNQWSLTLYRVKSQVVEILIQPFKQPSKAFMTFQYTGWFIGILRMAY